MALSPLNQRRWRNFRANKRAYWSLILFSILFGVSLFAEVLANDKPILVNYRGEWRMPFVKFYSEANFGGDFRTEANYKSAEVQCLIVTGGLVECFDEPQKLIDETAAGTIDKTAYPEFEKGSILWPPIPFSYNTINDLGGQAAPSAPDRIHWLGTDDTSRDVLARVIYGFRLSVAFALIVTALTSVVGIAAGAIQGYFGGWIDLMFQRFLEIWSGTPELYVIIIVFSVWQRSFWILIALMIAFGWTRLIGVVRAEFLRARNFEYVRAAKALGVSDGVIIWRHVLPNAMVATLTMLPFVVSGTIGSLAALDYLGFGLPASLPSLGQLSRQAQQNLQMPSLAFTAFFTFAIMLSLLVFIFEGVRDAFDPRKTFS
ncbi:MAG: ABC transporter permease [Cypionkella sp.]|jgi:microcin C transport system permease protein